MIRYCRGAVVIFGFLLGMLVFIPTSTAVQGDIEWSRVLPTTYTSGSGGSYRAAGVMTHGDGSVTATSCGSQSNLDDTQSMTLSPSKDVVNEITGLQSGAFCFSRGVVGIDGTVFYYEDATTIYNGPKKLVVAKNGVRLAEHSLAYSCSGTQYGQPQGMKVGADGNVYAVIQRGGCSQPHQLISLDGQTGQLRFPAVNLSTGDKYFSNSTLGVYDNGVVVVEDSVSSTVENLLTYIDYSGAKNNTLSCSIDGTTDLCGFSHGGANVGTVRLFLKTDGTAYLDTDKYVSGTCPIRKWTLKYTVAGTASSVTRPSTCTGGILHLTPQGNLVYLQGADVVVTNDSGTVQFQGNLNSKPGYILWRQAYSNEIMLDGNGDVVVMRVARPSSSPTTVQHFYLDRLNTDNTWTTLFSTEQLPNPNGLKFYSEGAYDVSNVAFADDFMYMALCTGGCSSTNAPVLYKISMPSMSIEYPRSAIFAEYISDHGEQLDYVAIGDSYSSGEGNSGSYGYIPPSNSNGCHRSVHAYSMLLDASDEVDLNLRSFRACSGATTSDIVSGRNSESGQLDSINSSTDVVTLTVGGNNIGFDDFAWECAIGGFDGCTTDSIAYENAMYAAENALSPTLQNLYEEILAKNNHLKLYVIGYPQLAPLEKPSGVNCDVLDGGFDYGGEATAAHLVSQALNTEILNEVNATKVADGGANSDRIEFIDVNATGSPFEGRDLCSSDPYFFGTSLSSAALHPNLDGQAAYAEIVAEAIAN